MIYKLKDTVDSYQLHNRGKSGVLLTHNRPYTDTELADYEYDDVKIAEWFAPVGDEPPVGDAIALRAWLLEGPVANTFPWEQVRELVVPLISSLINDAIGRGLADPPQQNSLDTKLAAVTVLNKLEKFQPNPSGRQGVQPRNERKGATVNERMAAMLQADPSLLSLSARQWKEKLSRQGKTCSEAAVKQTETWRKTIKAGRALQQADRVNSKRK